MTQARRNPGAQPDAVARSRRVYLDYAASAPMRPEALAAEASYEASDYAGANPNSLHSAGRQAARALDGARRTIARLAGGGFRPSDVVFTSGGTENNNLALVGMAEGARERSRTRTRVLISAIEHDSGLDVAPRLRERGFEVEFLRPNGNGFVEPSELSAMLDGNVALVSVMAANNETGVLQPIAELARLARAAGALVYCDAAQGFGKVPLDVRGCDALGVVGHKIGAPVGTGALLVRGRTPLRPQSFGGGQERGIRPGTQDVRGALALEAAAKACFDRMGEAVRELTRLSAGMYERLCAPSTGIVPTFDWRNTPRLPGMVSVMVPGVDSESLVLGLDETGFEVSAASACASGSLDASHVLLAMGIPRDKALGSLRVSFDERVAEADLDAFTDALLSCAANLAKRG